MKTEQKERTDIICPTCGHHTVSKLTRHGWACKECGTVTQGKDKDKDNAPRI